MVVIEVRDDVKSACWADGYMPSRDELRERYLAEVLEEATRGPQLAELDGYSSDDYLRALLGEQACRTQDTRTQPRQRYFEDIFVLRGPDSFPVPDGFSPVYAAIHGHRNEDYRQLVTVYASDWPDGRRETERLLDSCSFELRPGNSYVDRRAVESAVTALLEMVLEPYHAPCLAAERRLRDLGFLVQGFMP